MPRSAPPGGTTASASAAAIPRSMAGPWKCSGAAVRPCRSSSRYATGTSRVSCGCPWTAAASGVRYGAAGGRAASVRSSGSASVTRPETAARGLPGRPTRDAGPGPAGRAAWGARGVPPHRPPAARRQPAQGRVHMVDRDPTAVPPVVITTSAVGLREGGVQGVGVVGEMARRGRPRRPAHAARGRASGRARPGSGRPGAGRGPATRRPGPELRHGAGGTAVSSS